MRTCLCFVLVSLLVLGGVAQARADQAVDLQNLTERLEIIKQKMEKLRFCYNENCFYRQISSQIIPPH